MSEIPLEKILDYKGNRYELARACMEYAKCIRYLNKDGAAHQTNAKEVLVAIQDVLDHKIKYTSDKFQIEIHRDEVEFMKTFKNIEENKATHADTQTTDPDILNLTLKTPPPTNNALDNEDDQPYINPTTFPQPPKEANPPELNNLKPPQTDTAEKINLAE